MPNNFFHQTPGTLRGLITLQRTGAAEEKR